MKPARSPSLGLADLLESVADGSPETAGKVGSEVRHQAVTGLAHLFHGEHHSRDGVFIVVGDGHSP